MDTKLKVVMALSVIGAVAAAGAVKALDLESPTLVKPAPLYANGVTSPGGLTKIGKDIWVSDHLQGFCRLKPSTTFSEPGSVEDATCVTNAVSPGQATFDGSKNFVYVPDNSSKSQGVWRYTWTSTTRRLSRPILISGTRAGTANSLIGIRTTATAMDRNGNLYVGGIKSGFIFKVTNPSGTPAVTRVGQTSDGGGVTAIAIAKALNADLTGFDGSKQDLYIAEGAGMAAINDISACTRPALCVGFAVSTQASAPGGISSDGEKVYLSDISGTLVQYDVLNDISTPFNSIPLRLPTAVLIDLGTSSDVADDRLYVADDPTNGNGIAKGHVYWEFEQPGSTTTSSTNTASTINTNITATTTAPTITALATTATLVEPAIVAADFAPALDPAVGGKGKGKGR